MFDDVKKYQKRLDSNVVTLTKVSLWERFSKHCVLMMSKLVEYDIVPCIPNLPDEPISKGNNNRKKPKHYFFTISLKLWALFKGNKAVLASNVSKLLRELALILIYFWNCFLILSKFWVSNIILVNFWMGGEALLFTSCH